MEQNTPYNPFAEGVSTAAPDSFQAAIDYLLKNRQQATTQRRGLFTQPATVDTPTTNVTNVVKDVFGDRYRSSGSDSNSSEQPFTGNPYTPSRGGLSSLNRAVQYQDLAASLRGNPNAVGGIASLLTGGNPVVGVLARYGLPKLFDYLGNNAYEQYGQDMQQVGGELFNPANPNLAALAYNDPNYDAYRSDFPAGGVTYAPGSPATFYNDPNYDAYRSDANVSVGGPINTSLIQGTSLDSILGGQPGVGIDSGNFDSGGSSFSDTYTDAGGGSFDYSANTGYD